MFFFIGGIQPKTVTIDDQPRMCRSCGLYQARLKRIDHYLSLFFIPIFPVKKGEPFLECRSCGAVMGEYEESPVHRVPEHPSHCPHCGQRIEPSFRYCPFCGKSLQ